MKKYFMNLMLAVVASTLLFNSCDEKEVKEPIDILIEEGVLRGNLTHEVMVTCMVSFGESKHKPVKPLQSLLDVIPLILALSAKCTIHDVVCWASFIIS